MALSKKGEEEDYMQSNSSPEKTEEAPMPTPPEMLQIPTSLDAYEEINHHVDRERSMGMIVRNQGIA